MVQVKGKFSRNYQNNLQYELVCSQEETREHLLQCKPIIKKNLEDKYILAESEYSDLFGNIQQQKDILKCFSEILKVRETLVEN